MGFLSGLGVIEILFGVGITILVSVAVIAGMIAWSDYSWNKKQPLESLRVRVVAKRTDVSGGSGNTAAVTSYFVTFEHRDGSREEVSVSGEEYGLIAEGDRGTLRRQGTWYRGFQRNR